jgi:hypothetical protein
MTKAETVEALRASAEALARWGEPTALRHVMPLMRIARNLCEHARISPDGRCRYCGKRLAAEA